MSYITSENVRRFRALLETSLSPEKRKTIETLLVAEIAEFEREVGEQPRTEPTVDEIPEH